MIKAIYHVDIVSSVTVKDVTNKLSDSNYKKDVYLFGIRIHRHRFIENTNIKNNDKIGFNK